MIGSRGNKMNDDTPIFSIISMQSSASVSRMSDQRDGFVDICIEEQPPNYNDSIVIKPPKPV